MSHPSNTRNAFRKDSTDLEEVRRSPGRFAWGRVVAFHEIGRYTLIEYQRLSDELDVKTAFHVYVDGKSTSQSASSIESALIHAIALGKLEVNSARWMVIGALKLLELVE